MGNSRQFKYAACIGGILLSTVASCKETQKKKPALEKPAEAQPSEPTKTKTIEPIPKQTIRVLTCHAEINAGKSLTITVENLQTRDVESWIAWTYLYRNGKHVNRLRLEHNTLLGAGQTIKRAQPLVDEMPDKAECDVVNVVFSDGEKWQNDNLVFSAQNARPLGGPTTTKESPASLSWQGSLANPGVFTLQNNTKRELKVQRAGVFYLDASGSVLSQSVANVQQILNPSESTQLSLGVRKDRIPAETASIHSVVSEATFLDGEQEVWRDRNLERPR